MPTLTDAADSPDYLCLRFEYMNGADGTTTCLHSSTRDGSVVIFEDFGYDVMMNLAPRLFELSKLQSIASTGAFYNSCFIIQYRIHGSCTNSGEEDSVAFPTCRRFRRRTCVAQLIVLLGKCTLFIADENTDR